MELRYAFLTLGGLLLAGCATDDIVPVKIEMPVNRMEMPERSAGVINIGSGLGSETYLVLTRDQLTSAPSSKNPEVGPCPVESDGHVFIEFSDHCDGGAYLRGDARLGDYVQLGLRRSSEKLLTTQLKLYLAGPEPGHGKAGDVSLAVTGAYGKDEYNTGGFNDDYTTEARTHVQRALADYGVIFGYRWSSGSLIYGGPYYSRNDYSGRYTNTSPSSGSGGFFGSGSSSTQTTVQDFAGDAQMRGINIGINLGTPALAALLECARARVDAGDERSYVSRCALGFEASFGGRE